MISKYMYCKRPCVRGDKKDMGTYIVSSADLHSSRERSAPAPLHMTRRNYISVINNCHVCTFSLLIYLYIYIYNRCKVKPAHWPQGVYIYIYIDYCINAVVAPFIKSTFLNDPRLYFVVRSDFCTKLKLKYLATDAVTIWQATIMWSYTLKPYQPYSHCTDGSFSPSHISSTFKTSRHQQLSGNKKKKHILDIVYLIQTGKENNIFSQIYIQYVCICV